MVEENVLYSRLAHVGKKYQEMAKKFAEFSNQVKDNFADGNGSLEGVIVATDPDKINMSVSFAGNDDSIHVLRFHY